MAARRQQQESIVLIGLQDEEIHSSSAGDDQMPGWQCNKIGGTPDWMPCNVKSQNPLCEICQRMTALVMQINCPLGASPYHRTLYIFCCIHSSCWNKIGSWKVLRCQHPVEKSKPEHTQLSNNMSHGWVDDEEDWGMDSEEQPLEVPGVTSSLPSFGHNHPEASPIPMTSNNGIPDLENLNISTASQEQEMICSAEIEPYESDNPVCIETLPIDRNVSFLEWEKERWHNSYGAVQIAIPIFKSYYVSVIEEPDDTDDVDEHIMALLNDYQRKEGNPFSTLNKSSRGTVNEAYEKDRAQHGDQVFHKMLKRVSKCPNQIIRYQWNGQPLYITAPNSSQVVPSVCENCKSRRVFELQLMPALLQCLKLENYQTKGPPIEFGTVIVSTCSQSCWDSGDQFHMEYAYVQSDPDESLFRKLASCT